MTAETLRIVQSAPRLIYTLDAVVCFVLGLALMILAVPLATLSGALSPDLVFWAGLVLLPWAAFNLYTARVRRVAPAVIRLNLLGDAAWIAGSAIVLATHAGGLTTVGIVLVAGQALAVVAVLLVKFAGRHALA